jgi:intracellular septation protein
MQTALELAPLLAFIVAYRASGLYTATAVLIAAMALLLAVDYARERRIPPMHLLSAVLVFAFGAATLALHDKRFIQWKPTIFFWCASLAFLASTWIGKRPLVQRLLAGTLGEHGELPRERWLRINWLWVAFYALLGAANLLVAYHASESAWVNFKVFGLTAATFAFVALQVMWIVRQAHRTAST